MYFTEISKDQKEECVVAKPGRHVFLVVNYSGNVNIEIQSPGAEVFIFGIYIGRGKDIFKLNTIQHHVVGSSISDLLVKGVFFDESKFVYEGLIRIDKNAQQSNAYQKNQNLIMSKKVFVDSRPFLEILANDVRCTHGSTTGKLNEDMLYYLQARGIDYNKAEKLLIEGFVNDVFDRMKELGVKTVIPDLIGDLFE